MSWASSIISSHCGGHEDALAQLLNLACSSRSQLSLCTRLSKAVSLVTQILHRHVEAGVEPAEVAIHLIYPTASVLFLQMNSDRPSSVAEVPTALDERCGSVLCDYFASAFFRDASCTSTPFRPFQLHAVDHPLQQSSAQLPFFPPNAMDAANGLFLLSVQQCRAALMAPTRGFGALLCRHGKRNSALDSIQRLIGVLPVYVAAQLMAVGGDPGSLPLFCYLTTVADMVFGLGRQVIPQNVEHDLRMAVVVAVSVLLQTPVCLQEDNASKVRGASFLSMVGQRLTVLCSSSPLLPLALTASGILAHLILPDATVPAAAADLLVEMQRCRPNEAILTAEVLHEAWFGLHRISDVAAEPPIVQSAQDGCVQTYVTFPAFLARVFRAVSPTSRAQLPCRAYYEFLLDVASVGGASLTTSLVRAFLSCGDEGVCFSPGQSRLDEFLLRVFVPFLSYVEQQLVQRPLLAHLNADPSVGSTFGCIAALFRCEVPLYSIVPHVLRLTCLACTVICLQLRAWQFGCRQLSEMWQLVHSAKMSAASCLVRLSRQLGTELVFAPLTKRAVHGFDAASAGPLLPSLPSLEVLLFSVFQLPNSDVLAQFILPLMPDYPHNRESLGTILQSVDTGTSWRTKVMGIPRTGIAVDPDSWLELQCSAVSSFNCGDPKAVLDLLLQIRPQFDAAAPPSFAPLAQFLLCNPKAAAELLWDRATANALFADPSWKEASPAAVFPLLTVLCTSHLWEYAWFLVKNLGSSWFEKPALSYLPSLVRLVLSSQFAFGTTEEVSWRSLVVFFVTILMNAGMENFTDVFGRLVVHLLENGILGWHVLDVVRSSAIAIAYDWTESCVGSIFRALQSGPTVDAPTQLPVDHLFSSRCTLIYLFLSSPTDNAVQSHAKQKAAFELLVDPTLRGWLIETPLVAQATQLSMASIGVIRACLNVIPPPLDVNLRQLSYLVVGILSLANCAATGVVSVASILTQLSQCMGTGVLQSDVPVLSKLHMFTSSTMLGLTTVRAICRDLVERAQASHTLCWMSVNPCTRGEMARYSEQFGSLLNSYLDPNDFFHDGACNAEIWSWSSRIGGEKLHKQLNGNLALKQGQQPLGDSRSSLRHIALQVSSRCVSSAPLRVDRPLDIASLSNCDSAVVAAMLLQLWTVHSRSGHGESSPSPAEIPQWVVPRSHVLYPFLDKLPRPTGSNFPWPWSLAWSVSVVQRQDLLQLCAGSASLDAAACQLYSAEAVLRLLHHCDNCGEDLEAASRALMMSVTDDPALWVPVAETVWQRSAAPFNILSERKSTHSLLLNILGRIQVSSWGSTLAALIAAQIATPSASSMLQLEAVAFLFVLVHGDIADAPVDMSAAQRASSLHSIAAAFRSSSSLADWRLEGLRGIANLLLSRWDNQKKEVSSDTERSIVEWSLTSPFVSVAIATAFVEEVCEHNPTRVMEAWYEAMVHLSRQSDAELLHWALVGCAFHRSSQGRLRFNEREVGGVFALLPVITELVLQDVGCCIQARNTPLLDRIALNFALVYDLSPFLRSVAIGVASQSPQFGGVHLLVAGGQRSQSMLRDLEWIFDFLSCEPFEQRRDQQYATSSLHHRAMTDVIKAFPISLFAKWLDVSQGGFPDEKKVQVQSTDRQDSILLSFSTSPQNFGALHNALAFADDAYQDFLSFCGISNIAGKCSFDFVPALLPDIARETTLWKLSSEHPLRGIDVLLSMGAHAARAYRCDDAAFAAARCAVLLDRSLSAAVAQQSSACRKLERMVEAGARLAEKLVMLNAALSICDRSVSPEVSLDVIDRLLRSTDLSHSTRAVLALLRTTVANDHTSAELLYSCLSCQGVDGAAISLCSLSLAQYCSQHQMPLAAVKFALHSAKCTPVGSSPTRACAQVVALAPQFDEACYAVYKGCVNEIPTYAWAPLAMAAHYAPSPISSYGSALLSSIEYEVRRRYPQCGGVGTCWSYLADAASPMQFATSSQRLLPCFPSCFGAPMTLPVVQIFCVSSAPLVRWSCVVESGQVFTMAVETEESLAALFGSGVAGEPEGSLLSSAQLVCHYLATLCDYSSTCKLGRRFSGVVSASRFPLIPGKGLRVEAARASPKKLSAFLNISDEQILTEADALRRMSSAKTDASILREFRKWVASLRPISSLQVRLLHSCVDAQDFLHLKNDLLSKVGAAVAAPMFVPWCLRSPWRIIDGSLPLGTPAFGHSPVLQVHLTRVRSLESDGTGTSPWHIGRGVSFILGPHAKEALFFLLMRYVTHGVHEVFDVTLAQCFFGSVASAQSPFKAHLSTGAIVNDNSILARMPPEYEAWL